MTERISSITVILSEDVREDEPYLDTLCEAIGLLKGVASTELNPRNLDQVVAQARVRADMGARLVDAVNEIVYGADRHTI